ncbi:PAS domain-containing hybrid sensor histidine kinase/response regulator [Rhodohalobacter halophilus]|uniref:PAS domain-containing hybrid sensor histidine kinase/response regulator n=1 Tax=Rhodohalobacter halophilus TaxID=1812810 RepID=UPI00083FA014|nr:PAS domain-containing hybrid sensor histidine kinase/response regulator [Rhodohalobacter halophilus]
MSGDIEFLQKHATLISKLLNYTFDACLICEPSDGELRTLYANQTYYSLTEQAEEDVVGAKPRLTANKTTADNIYQSILKSFNQSETFEKECSGLTAAGNPFWAIVKSYSIDDGDEKFCVILIKDITIRKRRERELTKAVESAEESKVVKDKFLANMSHEMRTPLNGILGTAQLLEGTELSEEQADYVEEVRHSAENLLAIINDILEFNFLKSTQFKLENRKFNLQKQLSGLLETIKGRAEEKGLKLELVVSDKFPSQLLGDSVRLTQILMNLIGNSIKFTNEGTVTILARALKPENGRVPVEIKVKDSGIGIPESMVEDVFESFNQAFKSRLYKYGGTGIGLSIVKQLVGHMDGRIDVESEIGKGTTVTLLLPFELPGSSTEYKSLDQQESDEEEFSGHKILIVDDYPLNRRIVKGMLKRLGVEVDEAEDGAEALQLSEHHNYLAIFMDVHMPGMGGLEATRKIRGREEKKGIHTPIVAITASVLDRDIEECREAGMDGFMAKPFTYNQIYENFKKYVVDRESGEQLPEDDGQEPDELLNNLEEMTGGDQELIVEMLDLFLDQTPELMDQILEYFNQGKYNLVKSSSHTLKPTFTYIGMEQATELAKKIEEMAGREQVIEKELAILINELKDLCDDAIKRVGKVRERYS